MERIREIKSAHVERPIITWNGFIALAIGFWGHAVTGTGWNQIAGILGIATAVAAIYTSFAFVANATYRRTLLPT